MTFPPVPLGLISWLKLTPSLLLLPGFLVLVCSSSVSPAHLPALTPLTSPSQPDPGSQSTQRGQTPRWLRYLLSGSSSRSGSSSSSQNTAAALAPPSLLSIQAQAGCSLELSCGLLMGNTFMSTSRETCGVPGYSCVAAFAPFPRLCRGSPLPQLHSIIHISCLALLIGIIFH